MGAVSLTKTAFPLQRVFYIHGHLSKPTQQAIRSQTLKFGNVFDWALFCAHSATVSGKMTAKSLCCTCITFGNVFASLFPSLYIFGGLCHYQGSDVI